MILVLVSGKLKPKITPACGSGPTNRCMEREACHKYDNSEASKTPDCIGGENMICCYWDLP